MSTGFVMASIDPVLSTPGDVDDPVRVGFCSDGRRTQFHRSRKIGVTSMNVKLGTPYFRLGLKNNSDAIRSHLVLQKIESTAPGNFMYESRWSITFRHKN